MSELITLPPDVMKKLWELNQPKLTTPEVINKPQNIAQELAIDPNVALAALQEFSKNPNYPKSGNEAVVGFVTLDGVEYVVKNYHAADNERIKQKIKNLARKQDLMEAHGFHNYAPVRVFSQGDEYYVVQRRLKEGADHVSIQAELDNCGLHQQDLARNVLNFVDSNQQIHPVIVDFGLIDTKEVYANLAAYK
jgi:hypothetical protein